MNGKGDNPRNCFSKQFRDNYDSIDWSKKEKPPEPTPEPTPTPDE